MPAGSAKLVFVRVEDAHVKAVGEMLSSIKQTEYFFIILPLTSELLTREQVKRLMKEVLS